MIARWLDVFEKILKATLKWIYSKLGFKSVSVHEKLINFSTCHTFIAVKFINGYLKNEQTKPLNYFYVFNPFAGF